MPGGDRTGPAGMGPMTGRAAGYCAGYPVPGFMNPVGGRGYGGWGRRGGRGGGRGWGWGGRGGYGWGGWQRAGIGWPAFGPGQAFVAPPYVAAPYVDPPYVDPQMGAGIPATMSKEQELNVLRQQAEAMELQMKQLQERRRQLETGE